MNKKEPSFKKGERVRHISHGNGTVYIDSEGNGEVLVDFDKTPKGWHNPLHVSVNCISKERAL